MKKKPTKNQKLLKLAENFCVEFIRIHVRAGKSPEQCELNKYMKQVSKYRKKAGLK